MPLGALRRKGLLVIGVCRCRLVYIRLRVFLLVVFAVLLSRGNMTQQCLGTQIVWFGVPLYLAQEKYSHSLAQACAVAFSSANWYTYTLCCSFWKSLGRRSLLVQGGWIVQFLSPHFLCVRACFFFDCRGVVRISRATLMRLGSPQHEMIHIACSSRLAHAVFLGGGIGRGRSRSRCLVLLLQSPTGKSW